MQNLSISARLRLLAAITVVALLLLGGFGVLQLIDLQQKQLEASSRSARFDHLAMTIEEVNLSFKGQVQEWKDILLRGNDPAAFEKYFKAFQTQEQKVQAGLGKAREQAMGLGFAVDGIDTSTAAHRQLGERYREGLKKFDGTNPEAGKVVDRTLVGLDRPLKASLDEMTRQVLAAAEQAQVRIDAETAQSYARAKVMLTGGGLLFMAACVGLSMMIARSIERPLRAIEGHVAGMASTRDLSRSLFAGGNNEISRLEQALDMLFLSLRTTLTDVQHRMETVSATSGHLLAEAKAVNDHSRSQSSDSSDIAAAVEEMTQSMQHLAIDAHQAEVFSADSGETAARGANLIKDVAHNVSLIANRVGTAAETVMQLGALSGDIHSIVAVIRAVAEQTNLLALNAAIEAARAGESGRGFAVVADEVRKLAERTSAATSDIGKRIESIQSLVTESVAQMNQTSREVNEGVALANESGDEIDRITAKANLVLNVVRDVSSALNAQLESTQHIAQRVEQVAQGAESNAASSDATALEAERLNVLAESVLTEIRQFKVA